MVKVKICGLSAISDIDAVNTEKPDYIGFVFAESRRRINEQQASELRKKLSPGIITVGVFVNEMPQKINSLVQEGIIDVIQLHGAEDEEYICSLKRLTKRPVIKAIAVQKKGDVQKLSASSADYLLVDNISAGQGQKFNWDLIDEINRPFFLAGGLNAENIIEAIGKTKPFAVDVSSGVETDGFKDKAKIREFIRMARGV
jgi:phosphoribosylanthranilate isomerase